MHTGFLAKAAAAFAALAFAIVLTSAAGFAAEGFVGKYKTTDTEGKAFTIWLSDDGIAKGDRANEGLAGMWKEAGSAAVITWDIRLGHQDHQGRRQVHEDRGEGRQAGWQPVRRRKGRVAVQL